MIACSRLKQLGAAQAKHRRIRRWDILWRVYDLAVQWRALAKRQEARQADVEEAMDNPEATAADREMLDGLKEAFRNARTPEVCPDATCRLSHCLNFYPVSACWGS